MLVKKRRKNVRNISETKKKLIIKKKEPKVEEKKRYCIVEANYNAFDRWELEMDITKAYSWWIKFSTLYVNWTKEEHEMDPHSAQHCYEPQRNAECDGDTCKYPTSVDVMDETEDYLYYPDDIIKGTIPEECKNNKYNLEGDVNGF